MKFRYLSIVLMFILLVHHSSEQALSYSDRPNDENLNTTPSPNTNGIAGTIRNTTGNILQRLEGPRDRVLDFIKPAVKSDFSRNVTQVLNSVWDRVHQTNSSIIHNPLFRNSIVIPINTTLARLKEITAAENEHSELNESNLEIINLNTPEDESRFKEFLKSDANATEVENSVPVIFLVRDDEKEDDTVDKENTENRNVTSDNLAQASENNEQSVPILTNSDSSRTNELNGPTTDDEVVNNGPSDTTNPAAVEPVGIQSPAQPQDETLNPTKSLKKRRSARFMDDHRHYMMVTPERARNLFDNVQRHRMQECMALALCESNCRPESYEQTRHGLFRRLFDRVNIMGSDHSDYDYYLRARDHGRRYYGSEDCRLCQYKYNCPHDRDALIDRFYRMENFNNN